MCRKKRGERGGTKLQNLFYFFPYNQLHRGQYISAACTSYYWKRGTKGVCWGEGVMWGYDSRNYDHFHCKPVVIVLMEYTWLSVASHVTVM